MELLLICAGLPNIGGDGGDYTPWKGLHPPSPIKAHTPQSNKIWFPHEQLGPPWPKIFCAPHTQFLKYSEKSICPIVFSIKPNMAHY